MEARVQQGIVLKKIFECIRDMATDVNLDFTETGITLQAMDGSHVSLVVLTLQETFFEQYQCNRARSLGLNLNSICKVFKLCNPDNAVILKHEDNANVLTFLFENGGELKTSRFDLALMQIDSEHFGLPDTKFDAVVNMSSKKYQEICLNLSQFSDTVTISVDQNHVTYACKGDIGNGTITLKKTGMEGEEVHLMVNTAITHSFSAKYLNFIGKSTILANQINFSMTEGSPLRVTYNIQDDQRLGNLVFYLAPKLDDSQA